MGAWAEDTFGNDTACDWIGMFLDEPGLPALLSAIQEVVESEEYLDSEEACFALAACEAIARLQGKWGLRNPYSENLDKWIESNPTEIPDDLKLAAEKAIDRILAPESELPEMWDDGGRNEAWHKSIDDLRVRVRG